MFNYLYLLKPLHGGVFPVEKLSITRLQFLSSFSKFISRFIPSLHSCEYREYRLS
jgi:hypothetical protein